MSTSDTLSWEKWDAVSSNIPELSRLINVVDEQDLLTEYMSSVAVKEIIEGTDNNLGRMRLVAKSMLKEENVGLFNALCGYFLDRSKAYEIMYHRFSGTDPEESFDRFTQLAVLQDKINHLTEEVMYWHEQKPVIKEQIDEVIELKKKVDGWIQKESITFQQLQTSLEAVSKVARPPAFPNPHSDEMQAKVAVANASHWNTFTYKLVPFLCNENGEYFVDWENNDDQWKFTNWGKQMWTDNVGRDASGAYVNLLGCSLLLPRQYNASGLNDRVVDVFLYKYQSSLYIYMSHYGSPSANVASTTVKCYFQLLIKHNDDTSLTEFREVIQCNVVNSTWQNNAFNAPVTFTSFSGTVAPSLRLTLVPM